MLSIHDMSPILRDPFIPAGNFPNFLLAGSVFEGCFFRPRQGSIHDGDSHRRRSLTTRAGNRKAELGVPRTLFG